MLKKAGSKAIGNLLLLTLKDLRRKRGDSEGAIRLLEQVIKHNDAILSRDGK